MGDKKNKEQVTKHLSLSSKTISLTNTTETAADQYELEKARELKKRDIKTKQYSKYVKSLYGSPMEKEELRKEQREALLTQVREKEHNSKDTLKNKVKESEAAVAYDRECLETDKQQRITRASYLKQFRDGNKQLIETRSEQKRRQREEENKKERELLKQNPINWSNTLC